MYVCNSLTQLGNTGVDQMSMSTMLLYDLLSHITQHTLRYFSTAVYKEQQEEDNEKKYLIRRNV